MTQKTRIESKHEHLVFLAKKKLRLMGYEVYERGKRLRVRAKERGFY
jgi:hypothetical protein